MYGITPSPARRALGRVLAWVPGAPVWLLGVALLAGLLIPAALSPTVELGDRTPAPPAPVQVVEEDEPGWDCRVHGDGGC